MQDASGTHDYTYYADSALSTASGPWDNDTITYNYDKLGRITGVSPQSGQALSYTYDDLNRLTNIQAGTNNFAYGYTGADPLVQTLTRPGGQTIYEYNDPLKRLTALINNDASAQLVNRFDYAYSDASHPDQRSSETVTNSPSFTFPQNELIRYEHNSLNQLIRTTDPEKLFTYDDAGNMTKGYTPDGYQFTATYDAENRLASIEYTDSQNTVHKAEYIYSGYGFLAQIKKYENGTPVGDTRITRSGYLALQERDASNAVVKEYTWGLNMGGGIGGLLNMRQGGNDYKYLYDGRGNVSALLNTSQQVAASYRYDSFGNLMATTGTLDQPFGFSTKRYDTGTGLSYYGYRFYAPTIGKWLTRDPLGEAGGINLYGFCLNDPVNAVDPFGLWTFQGGLSFTAGGILGSTKGIGLIVGRDPSSGKWQFGWYAVGGFGAFAGAEASVAADFTWSSNPCIEDVGGLALTVGGSAGMPVGLGAGGEVNIPLTGDAKPSYTFSVDASAGLPVEGHAFGTYTHVRRVW